MNATQLSYLITRPVVFCPTLTSSLAKKSISNIDLIVKWGGSKNHSQISQLFYTSNIATI
jgi:hypothetical protein